MGSSAPFLLVGAPHRFAVDGDHFGRRLRQRRRPRYETALERDRVEPGEDDAQLVVRGRAVGEASKALQERTLGPAEARNVGHRLRPRQRRRQHQKQHLVERIGDLPLLPVVRQGLEIRQKNRRLPHRPGSRVPFRHRPILRANQRITTNSARRPFVTRIFSRLPASDTRRACHRKNDLLDDAPSFATRARSPMCGHGGIGRRASLRC